MDKIRKGPALFQSTASLCWDWAANLQLSASALNLNETLLQRNVDDKEHLPREEMDLIWNLQSFIITIIFPPTLHICVIVLFSCEGDLVEQIKDEMSDKAHPSEPNWSQTWQRWLWLPQSEMSTPFVQKSGRFPVCNPRHPSFSFQWILPCQFSPAEPTCQVFLSKRIWWSLCIRTGNVERVALCQWGAVG